MSRPTAWLIVKAGRFVVNVSWHPKQFGIMLWVNVSMVAFDRLVDPNCFFAGRVPSVQIAPTRK